MTSLNANSTHKQNSRQWGGWLANIGVGWKLTLVIFILAIGFAGIFYSAYVGLQTLQYHIANLYDYIVIPVTSLDRADIELGNIQTQLEIIHGSNLSTKEKIELLDGITPKEELFSSSFQRYTKSWLSTLRPDFTANLNTQGRLDLQKDEIATISQINNAYEHYIRQRDKLRALIETAQSEENAMNSTIAAVGALRNQVRHLADLTRQFAEVSKKAAQAAYNQALFIMGTSLAISAGLGLFLAFLVSRSIIYRLGFVTRAAQSLQQGHLEGHASTGVGGRDEIAQLAVAFDAMGEQLTQTLEGLEQRVAERTTELEKRTEELEIVSGRMKKRADQFQAVAQVSRAVTSIQNIEELLPHIAKITSEQLGFYHVGIFLLSKDKGHAILSAANSEGGKRMLQRGHKLQVGAEGLVGYVAAMGRPRIALDTGADAIFFNNPDLKNTHSEMALPLSAGDEIIGVLDVQSEDTAAFVQEDVELFTILADQVSIAIQNARQFEETQEAIKESETTIRQYLRREWKGIIDEAQSPGYRFSVTGVDPLTTAILTPNVVQAAQSGQTSVAQDKSERRMAIPIKLRGQVIGVMHLQSPSQRAWEKDVMDITQAIADRVALAIENARLLESSQNQAARERTVGEITSKIGASVNLRNVLQTAVEELGRILPGSDVVIQLEGKRKE